MKASRETVAFARSSTYVRFAEINSFEKEAATLQCHVNRNRFWCGALRMGHERPTSRRAFNRLLPATLAVGYVFQKSVFRKTEAISSPFATPEDLTQRLRSRVVRESDPKLYQNDIFYPDYFSGIWRTESTLLAVECPAGYKLFGRAGSFEAAKDDIDKPLEYQSRFIRFGNSVISDRPFNVTSIAKASMGAFSVLHCSSIGSSPNRLTMTLRPSAAEGAVFNVDLRVIARLQQTSPVPSNLEGHLGMVQRETVDVDEEGDGGTQLGLYTSETMRQEVRPDTNDLRVMPLVKEVETTTLFILDLRDKKLIRGWQKTSVYLTRSDLRYLDARGRPIDVRWYRLQYSKD